MTHFDTLMNAFLDSVSFERGGAPDYERIRELFIARGLLIRNIAGSCEVTTVDEFIAPRRELVRSGRLTEFREMEMDASDTVFGGVAHRTSTYGKTGVQDGVPFEARGVILTQFVEAPEGWRISSMAWDDERPGLSLDALVSGDTASPV